MNVACPQCKTVFRVDPHKVPADGTRARCSVCGGVFDVVAQDDKPKSPAAATTAPPAMPEVSGPAIAAAAPAAEPIPPGPTEARMEPAAPAASAWEPLSEPPRAAQAASAAQESAAAAGPDAGVADTFGDPGPGGRARRLARALISDLAVYNPDRQEIGLREGRLKEVFRQELKKSWQEYVEQVGLETAKATPHFRDALNEILAKGKKIF